MGTKLTVFFDDPFWVGVFERQEDRKLSACRITFGAEPKDYEVHAFILRHFTELAFSPAVESAERQAADNPKRRARSAKKQLAQTGVGTKSQQALQLQREQNKLERKVKSREEKLAEDERRFALRQQKKKDKHRGR